VPIYGLKRTGELTTQIIGYSKDCRIPTQASYYYQREGNQGFYPLSEANGDIAKTTVNGRSVDFIVRVEFGTINRFIYAIAVLMGENETLHKPNGSHWNRRLVYQFDGGVGIGHRQGRVSPNSIFKRRAEQLAQGYAVIYSSGTKTSNHSNIWLSEDTALRLKRQFVALYGEPDYTIGIGGSGGAIQQYLLAQNNPGILDAAIAEYSYPDMLTQTTYGLDCELLEYFFDVTDRHNQRWQEWDNRRLIEGTNSRSNGDNDFLFFQQLSQIRAGAWPSWGSGVSECVLGWRGLGPLVNNPRYTKYEYRYSRQVLSSVHWTHWNDLENIYGTDEQGYGYSTWDNVGVQYGLKALHAGRIDVEEFIDINASIGGWKPPADMKKERFWFYPKGDYLPVRISVWSHHNMVLGSGRQPAPRNEGNLQAMAAAYRAGLVFLGKLTIPVIDLRHYLEHELDMHHVSASFSVRKRMLKAQGNADNQLIWISDKAYTPEAEAFELMDRWLRNIKNHSQRSIADNKPADALDACFDHRGDTIAAGPQVWDGDWNHRPMGVCSQRYPSYTTSRQQAGGDIAGDVLKCHLQSVSDAIDKGIYGDIDMQPYIDKLQSIFATGVCDYSKGDMGRPIDLLTSAQVAAAVPP
jgi:hypothetical protein